MAQKEGYLDFDEYIVASEPHKRERAEAWKVAIGLQAVDGLKTSAYLQETARRNIEGEISIDEARALVNQYYITKNAHDNDDTDKEEADRVSSNIVKVRNRYLHIHPTEEWSVQPNLANPTNTPQVQDKYRTSSGFIAYR